MFALPRGNALYENIAAGKVKVPEMLEKLRKSGFSGYVSFVFPGAEGILLFEGGKMISALRDGSGGKSSGLEAIAAIFASIFEGSGSFNVYRLSRDLTMCIHALLHGEMLYKAQELKLIDIKVLLGKFRDDRLNGCLRIYTTDRSALIFYKDGSPLGFFHDGSQDIETSATESQKVAALPGAKLDVLSTKSVDELMLYDLLEMVNVSKLWETAEERHRAVREKARREEEERARRKNDAAYQELLGDLREIGLAYMGRMGGNLVEKELGDRGGRSAIVEPAQLEDFLKAVERGAKLLMGASKIPEMIELMRDEIGRRPLA